MSKKKVMTTKQDLIKGLAGATGITMGDSAVYVNTLMDIVRASLVSTDGIALRGLCQLKVGEAPAKRARNISKGTEVMIPARKVVRFRLNKDVQFAMNQAKL